VTPWLLMPVKSLRGGKGRLAPVLDAEARAAFNRFLLTHMIDVARDFPGAERTAVISASDEVLSVVAAAGMLAIRQSEAPGMNAAVAEGVASLRSRADDILILPVDLPLVVPDDLRRFAAIDRRCRIVLCPDRRNSGTNGMLLRGAVAFDFGFGEDSFALHWQRATQAGAMPCRFDNARIAFDIDGPEDFEAWRRLQPDQAQSA